jgi:hypothetical protein
MVSWLKRVKNSFHLSSERDVPSLAILPTEECARLYQIQVGWSQPICDAIVQLFDFFAAELSSLRAP